MCLLLKHSASNARIKYTVEPLYSGQPWDRNYWPDNQGGHISGVNLHTCACNWDKQHTAVIERWPQFRDLE